MENLEYVQTPVAKLDEVGNRCVLILEDWNTEEAIDGYSQEEVKSLIEMLQQSLDIMSRYNRVNDKMPLFENWEESQPNVQQDSSPTRVD
jgi:hypothetical protein